MTPDANLTSDNQPTQSFDDVLEDILIEMQFGKKPVLTSDAMAAIKAAIVEARPEKYPVQEYGYLSPSDYRVIHNAALDEWSKNMELGE